MFGEPNNFEITRSFYAKRTPFPLNFYYPSSYQKEAYDIVYTMGGFDIDDKLELHGGDYVSLNLNLIVLSLRSYFLYLLLADKCGQKMY